MTLRIPVTEYCEQCDALQLITDQNIDCPLLFLVNTNDVSLYTTVYGLWHATPPCLGGKQTKDIFEISAASVFEVEVTYTLQKEAESSFGTLVPICQSARRLIPEDHNPT